MTETSVVAPLFVPADRPDRFEKAASSGADAVILDLEDAVAPERKLAARENLRADFGTVPVWVRINAFGTPWFDEDLDRVLSLPFAAIMIPKAESADTFTSIRKRTPDMCMVALIETALGLSNARAICRLPGVFRLGFGSIDYAADLGCDHGRDALLSARSELVLASRLAGLSAPLDGVTTALDDPDAAERDASAARQLGFGGKLAIHPKQIEPIRAGFQPTTEEIRWATFVLSSGDGAIRVAGNMIDEPARIRARAILARSSR